MKVIDPELLNSVELKPLQQLAAVRVAVSACESEDVQHMILSFSKMNGSTSAAFSDDQWKQLCGKVKNKFDQIGVPELIIDIILEKLWIISFQIFKWILCHDADMGIDSSIKFCWTPHITIDYEKTAKFLTKNEALGLKKRFKLACLYCLEVEVRFLWEMMSLSVKRSFFVRGNLKKSNLNPIILYWAYYIQEVSIDYWGSKILNHTQLFKYAVANGYVYATMFFLGKINKQLRNRMISSSFGTYCRKFYRAHSIIKDSHFAIAYFLFSEWSLHYLPYIDFPTLLFVIHHFLEWPLQKHFMTVVEQLSSRTDEETYSELFKAIFEKDLGGFRDFDYKKLFMTLWLQSPERCKTYVNTKSRVGFKIFFRFVEKHFGFIFEEHSFTQKAKFRAAVLQRERPENITDFGNENVEFFKFLIRKRFTTESAIRQYNENRLPLGELKYLMDGILGSN